MFLGQAVMFTRSGTTLLGFDGAEVGAIHVSQTGFDRLTVTGAGVNASIDLVDGYNLITWDNARPTSLALVWTGSGSVEWSTLGLYRNDVVLEEASERPTLFSAVYTVPDEGPYSTNTVVSGRFGYEWRYLSWERVDALEVLFDRHGVLEDPQFVLVLDGRAPERHDVIITSSFDFYQTTSNFNGGASGALVFETVS